MIHSHDFNNNEGCCIASLIHAEINHSHFPLTHFHKLIKLLFFLFSLKSNWVVYLRWWQRQNCGRMNQEKFLLTTQQRCLGWLSCSMACLWMDLWCFPPLTGQVSPKITIWGKILTTCASVLLFIHHVIRCLLLLSAVNMEMKQVSKSRSLCLRKSSFVLRLREPCLLCCSGSLEESWWRRVFGLIYSQRGERFITCPPPQNKKTKKIMLRWCLSFPRSLMMSAL